MIMTFSGMGDLANVSYVIVELPEDVKIFQYGF